MPPLASTGQSRVAALSSVRRLTPVECERLQGFPDGWTAGEKDSTRYRMLGNAVCVPVARWIGKRFPESTTPVLS
ncbi:MAG: DNA cytosine methyltransferase [Actinomycetota bacterium]